MSKGGDEELRLSDWITYLSSEKTNLANVIGMGGVALAAVSVIVGVGITSVGLREAALIPIWVIAVLLITKFGRDADKAGKFLKKIMNGDLKDPDQIQKEWKDP